MKTIKTKQNAESELTINTWAYIIEYRIPNKVENTKENTDEVAAST